MQIHLFYSIIEKDFTSIHICQTWLLYLKINYENTKWGDPFHTSEEKLTPGLFELMQAQDMVLLPNWSNVIISCINSHRMCNWGMNNLLHSGIAAHISSVCIPGIIS
jgi:hypothetical protein